MRAPRVARDDRPCTITPHRDGPYLVRGPFTLADDLGREVRVRRRTVALCRCGRSRLQPFCDGTHRLIGFRDGAEGAPRDGLGGGAARAGASPRA